MKNRFQYDEDIRYTSPYRDGDVRMVSLEFAVAQGIFVGRCMRDLYLSGQPPMFLTPATISVSFAVSTAKALSEQLVHPIGFSTNDRKDRLNAKKVQS